MKILGLIGTLSGAALIATALSTTAFAQDGFPTGDLTFVVQAAAGGASDRSSRALAAEMEKELGVSFIVENRPGASGTVAFAHVAEQAPDGYTIGFSPVEFAILENIGYDDFDRSEFTYLGQIMNSPVVLAVPADSPYNTLGEFITAAEDTQLSVANSGAASSFAAATVTLANMTGAQLNPGPFDGGAPAVAAALGGHVDAVAAGAGEATTPYNDGTLKILAIFDDERHPALPDIPTAQEEGYDLTFGAWGGVYGPAGIPDDVVAVLQDAVEKAALSDAFRDAVSPAGIIPVFRPGAEFEEFIASEAARYAEVLN